MTRLQSLRDRSVLITGASSGIGRAIAERAAKDGARLALVARRKAELDLLADRVQDLGGEAHVLVCDVADRHAALESVARAESLLGGVDVAVINAGVGRHRTLVEHDLDDAERLLRVNVLGALYFAHALAPRMLARGRGWMAFMASVAGLLPVPGEAVYSASKFALVGLAEVLWHELAGSGVRACAVCPGDVRTDQLEQEHEWGPTGGVPPERAMSPDYLAAAIVKSLGSRNPVVIVDKPHLRAVFNLWGGSRRLRLAAVHGAYKDLLKT